MTTDAVFDLPRLLALDGMREAQVFRGTATAIYPDGTVDLRYENVPQGAYGAATAWLQENRVTLTDATVAGVKLAGTWRTVTVQEQQREEGGRKVGSVLVQRFAKGLYDTLDWSVCRVAEGKWALGNTKNADSTAGTTSAAPARWHTLRMPYVRPDKAKVIADGITNSSWTNLVAGGVKHDGVWYNLGAAFRLEEDQTASVLITIAQPVFTTEGYRNAGTYESEQRFLVANVPTQSIQGILDAWKSGRKGADGVIEGLNTAQNTANLILTVPVPVAKSSQRVRTTEDAFKVVTATTNINQSAAGTLPATAKGYVYSTDNEETGLGKHNVTQTVDAAKAGETPEHVVTVMADGTQVKAHTARHLDPASLPAWAAEPASHTAGTATRITRELNEYGGVGVQRQDRVVSQVRRPVTGTYTYERDFGDVHIVEYDFVLPAALPTILNEFGTGATDYEATHNISASPEYDPATGTFSVRLMAVPKGGGSGGGGTKAIEVEWEENQMVTRTYRDANTDAKVTEYALATYYRGVIQNTRETTVEAWIANCGSVGGLGETSLQPLGRWGFRGEYKKFMTMASDWTAMSYDEI